jgi:uncharacterized protein
MARVIDIFALAERGAQVAGAADPAEMARLEGLAAPLGGGDGVHFVLQGRIDAQGRPAASLHLQGAVTLRCDRCEQPLHWQIDERREFYFVRTERELAAIPVDELDEEALLGSTHLDLDTLIEDEAILALPLSPRHAVCPATQATTESAAPAVAPAPPRGVAGDAGGAPRSHRPFATLARLRGRRPS